MLLQGTVIADKYEIIRVIGRGGMSVVYLAMDISLNKQWAIKAVDKTSDEYKANESQSDILSEAAMMKDLDHPALPRIVDIIEERDVIYVVMDYIEGESLSKFLSLYGPVKQDMVVDWALQLCDVLSYLHHRDPPIIYRDMKPANIMMRPDGRVKVIDFGIARKYKKENIEDTVSLGTKGYAAPEQFSGHGQTDQRTDIYNLGVTIYQLLTGKNPAEPPYRILPITKVNANLSGGLEKIIEKATQRDPDKRYQSAEEMADAIANYKKLEEEAIASHRKKVSSYLVRLVISIILITGGISCLITNNIITQNRYSALISTGEVNSEQKEKSLEKAINLCPDKSDAYKLLIKEYARDGMTEQEASDFSAIFSDNREKIQRNKKNYAELTFTIGKYLLMYYRGKSDDSDRNRIITAEPFFSDSLKYGIKGEEKKEAETYKFLSDYYTDHVLTSSGLAGSEASKREYSKLISKCDSIINVLDEQKGLEKKHLQAVTYEIIQGFISSEVSVMAEKGIESSRITDLEKTIYEHAESINTTSSETAKILDSIRKNDRVVKLEIKSAYEITGRR